MEIINCQDAHLDAPNAVLSSKFTTVFEPADSWHGAAHGGATKLHCVASRNSIQLLFHTLCVGPIGTCMEKDQLLDQFNTLKLSCANSSIISAINAPLEK